MIAFDEIISTSGYLLPKVELRRAGLKPVEMASVDSTVKQDEVGYIFTNDDEVSIQWVLSGKAAAGAIDNRRDAELPADTRAQLTVLAETQSLPRHVVLARAGMALDLAVAIGRRLAEAHESSEGRAVLETFEKTARFDELLPEAWVDQMRALVAFAEDR